MPEPMTLEEADIARLVRAVEGLKSEISFCGFMLLLIAFGTCAKVCVT